MIMTVSELRQYIQSEESDQVLEAKLSALELLIRAYTNNNFMIRPYRAVAVACNGNELVTNGTVPFRAGDTLQITGSDLQPDALVTVQCVSDNVITINEDLIEESAVVITKIKYPADVKMGVINLMKWDLDNRDKVGVASETISRHNVTYFNMDAGNTVMGFPVSLMGFLKAYKKARFGKGIRT